MLWPCHNLFDTFVLGTNREVYVRGPTSSNLKQPLRAGRSNKSSNDDEDESDAEEQQRRSS